MKKPRIVACAVALALAACSGEDEGRYSGEEVQAAARRFHDALVAGDAAAASQLAGAPFRYKETDRVWATPADVQKNLAKEIPRIQHLLGGLNRIEAFSRPDLLAGKWPRASEVPKHQAEAKVRAAGIAEHGWLVRIFAEGKPGYTLVLNQDGDRLVVTGIDV